MDGLTESEARFIASEWHGGQFQPLYALSSTGTVVAGCADEVRRCLKEAETAALWGEDADPEWEIERLTALLEYVEAREPDDDDDDDDDDC